LCYLALANLQVLRFRQRCQGLGSTDWPAITVLKPLCGDEPGLYERLRSFCQQNYPVFQLIFGVCDAADPAVKLVRRLQDEFPRLDLQLVVDARIHGANRKVSNLINMMAYCRHDLLLLADSDVYADENCFRRMLAPLADPKVDAAISLYRGVPGPGLAARFGALYINDWFIPSALVDVALNGPDGWYGPLTAVRRSALEAVGGFVGVRDVLAEDNRLGRLIRRRGGGLVLVDYAVPTAVTDTGFLSLLRHELRWSRTVRACRARDHLLSLVTFPLPLLLLLLALLPSALTAALVGVHLLGRLALHLGVRSRCGSPLAFWMLPAREFLCFFIWLMTPFGKGVTWRGRRFLLRADGRLEAEPELPINALFGAAVDSLEGAE